MGQPFDRSPHTLAQLARRAKISEGRARALLAASPSGLPRPDRTDADGRPLWWASTIDAWCARTGREVNADSLWVFRVPPATAPAAELQRGVITLGGRGGLRRQTFYVIVWDTEHGHVIYLQPLDGTGGDHKDWMAVHAAELIEPRWWADAVVVMPIEQGLNYFPDHASEPLAYVYRLTTRATDDDASLAVDGVLGGLRRFFQRATGELAGPPTPSADWVGQLNLAEIATVVGRRIPLWLEDTQTSANGEQTLSYDQTFTVPDTSTDWPAAQSRLERAVEAGMLGQYPAAFAALAVDAAETLARVRSAHEHTADSGPGWYLVCRPARPAPSIELEQLLSGASVVTDLELVATELAELRQAEGELDVDDPIGDAYAAGVAALTLQLKYAAKAAGRIRSVGQDYLPVADDGLLRYSAPFAGPVVDAWRKTLTPVADVDAVLRLRRIRRVLRSYDPEWVREAYLDGQGRYVLVVELSQGLWSVAEWPASLAATQTWTDKTVLAGDNERGTVTTLLALTPTEDGRMQVDPVPLMPNSDRDAFAYGYGGGTPGTTYHALLRCGLGDEVRLPTRLAGVLGEDGEPVSQLWKAISTTSGPLRLHWSQLQLWAKADKNYADSNPDSIR